VLLPSRAYYAIRRYYPQPPRAVPRAPARTCEETI